MYKKRIAKFLILSVIFLFALSVFTYNVTSAKNDIMRGGVQNKDVTENAQSLPANFLGTWEGSTTTPSSWTILLTLVDGQIGSVVGTSTYPSPGCGGELTLQAVNTNSIELYEHIAHGPASCEDGGTVTLLKVSENEVSYSWEKAGIPGTSSGSLSRVISARNDMPYSITGIWSGEGDQGNAQWTILIGLGDGEIGSIVGTIAYPSLDCGGEYTLLSATGNSIALYEELTYGLANCYSGGTVTLDIVTANKIDFRWWEKDGTLGATGSLSRISQEFETVYLPLVINSP